jgi:protein-S-isoprenylcysteine O-methyltransferase Ste14
MIRAMTVRAVPTWARNIPVPEAYLAALAVGVIAHWVVPWRVPLPLPVRLVIGVGLLASGLGVIAASVRAAAGVHLAHADRAVVTGPYARCRHPMYVGWALLLAGAGVASGSAWLLVALVPAAASIHRSVRREEQALRRRFGADFEHYEATVPRYLPRLLHRRGSRLPER